MLLLIRQLNEILGGVAPLRLAMLIVLFALSSGLDSFSIVLVFSLFKIIVEPGQAEVSSVLSWGQSITGLAGASFILLLAGALLSLFLLKAVVHVAALILRWRTDIRLRAGVTRQLFGWYLHAPYLLHLRRTTGELSRNVHTSAGTCVATTLALCDVTGDLLLLIGISSTLIIMQPTMALGVIGLFGGLGLFYLWVTRKFFQRLGKAAIAANEQVYRAAFEPLGGVKQIKAVGADRFFIERYVNAVRAFMVISGKSTVMQQSLKPLFELVLVLALIAPVMLALSGGGSAASLVPVLAMFGAAAYRLMPSLLRATSVLQGLRFAGADIGVVHADLLAARRHAGATDADEARHSFAQALVLDRVGFRYDDTDRPALADISLTIRRGQAIGVVGASGAGKTTLVDVILGLLSPTSGRILLDGEPLPTRPHPRLFGYVPQDGFIVNDTIRQNIALGIADQRIDPQHLDRAIEAASLSEVIAGLPRGLDTIVGDHGLRLSGGQRQRLSIARALCRESEILILDEATSSLDPVTEAEISAAVDRLRGRRTLIIIAHRLSTVRNCDRIVLLEAGRIADSGTFAELALRNTRFREMVSKLDVSPVEHGEPAGQP
jgi:ABC-type multidrug transport system fused ATPase/permease subunit